MLYELCYGVPIKKSIIKIFIKLYYYDENSYIILRNRLPISVSFLLNNFHKVLQSISSRTVNNNSSSQITKDMWAHCLNGIQVPAKKKEHYPVPIPISFKLHKLEKNQILCLAFFQSVGMLGLTSNLTWRLHICPPQPSCWITQYPLVRLLVRFSGF